MRRIGYVYLIRMPTIAKILEIDNIYKIGHSVDPTARFYGYIDPGLNAIYEGIEEVFLYETGFYKEVEKRLHRELIQYHWRRFKYKEYEYNVSIGGHACKFIAQTILHHPEMPGHILSYNSEWFRLPDDVVTNFMSLCNSAENFFKKEIEDCYKPNRTLTK